MARVAVIGERASVEGWALAGAEVHGADDAAGVRQAWDGLDAEVEVVVLTPAAAGHLAGVLKAGRRLTVVLPG